MSYKLKQNSIPSFSRMVASGICDQFFASNSQADGGALMKFTASKQVNAFLVKALFEKWQEETQRLKSPYFDFDNKKVKEALQVFMNTISEHISVGREAMQVLLEEALQDTVLITFDPVGYVAQVVARGGSISKKYIKTRKDSFKRLTSLSLVSASDFEAEPPVSPEDFVAVFGASVSDLFEEESVSFFDRELDDDDEDDLIPMAAEPEPTATEPELEPEPVIPEADGEVTTPVAEAAESVSSASDAETINDRFNGNGKVQTLADKLKKNSQKGLESGLNLNEKFMFQNSLFGGSKEKMSEALSDLDQADGHEDAKIKAYKYSEAWDMESDEVAAFFEVLERHFA